MIDIFAWIVLIVLPGATGTAAIFTDHVRVAHVIRRVWSFGRSRS